MIIMISGCGTKNLRDADYSEVENGNKSLLITNNIGSLNFFSFLWEIFIGDINKHEEIVIDYVDKTVIHRQVLKDNQHVIIEPGIREVSFSCQITYKDKEKNKIESGGQLTYMFEAGAVYSIRVENINEWGCDARIEMKQSDYNKSLKPRAHKAAHTRTKQTTLGRLAQR